MRKLIPIIIMIFVLMASFIDFDTTVNNPINPGNTDDVDREINLPSAGQTDTIEQAEQDVTKTHRTGVNRDIDRGSRFAMTTNTIVTIDTPDVDSQIAYADHVVISGHLYEDYDNNGSFDEDVDIPIPNAKIDVYFAGEEDDPDKHSVRTTDENGQFIWEKDNYIAVSGLAEIKAMYRGEYTLNGSDWFPVEQRLNWNEDGDWYIDVGYKWVGGGWKYDFNGGNGKFDVGEVDTTNCYRVGGDVIIGDIGIRPEKWDAGDLILHDPLAYNSSDFVRNYYTTSGPHPDYGYRIDFNGSLIDEEWPDVPLSGRWADDDGDWNVSLDDVGSDGTPGTSDADGTEGNNWPDLGEPHVDEDINFTLYRKASECVINITLWNPSKIEAKVYNSTGKVTNKAVVGDTITIKGKLRNTVRHPWGVANRAIKFKIFGNWIPEIVGTDNQGDFNYSYEVPTHHSMRVGLRNIDIIFNEELYDPDYDVTKPGYPSYLQTTSLADQEQSITLRIYRPTFIVLEKSEEDQIGYLFKSISINGTLVDDNGNSLSSTVLHDDGTTEILLLDAYKMKFEWGREVNRYYDYLERDLLDTTGNFSIINYEIIDPFQELGEIRIKFTITMNASQTYYLSTEKTSTVTVRGNTLMELWIDQDRDTYKNEQPGNQKGSLADYITRVAYEDKDGKVWDFNRVVVYGRLAIRERPDNGINGKTIQYKWEDDDEWRTTPTQPIDIDLNGKYSPDETGMFIIPDPSVFKKDPPKIIEPSDPLGPLALDVKFEDPTGYYDRIELSKDFDIVAMTKVVINPGSGIKGENVTITGKLIDDLNPPDNGVPNQNINLYWEDMKGELLDDDKFNPVKLADNYIGNVTTDENGKFFFYSEEILTRDIDVGQGYIVGIYDGSVPPYTETDAFIGSNSEEVVFDVSSHTKIKIKEKPKKLIRGKHFSLTGEIIETYQGDENLDSKVLLTIADIGQMEVYIRNINSLSETRLTNLEVEFKSEGGFSVTGIVPYNLDVGQSALRLVFNGTKNGRYLPAQIISYYEIWTETFIKLLSPDPVEKDDGTGYFLRDDLYRDDFDYDSPNYIAPLVFRIQLLEINPTEGAEIKPVANGKILLNVSGKYSVFINHSSKYTDSGGYANFTFNSPLTDTDWGYQLPSTASVELEIIVEFTGYIEEARKSYFEPTKTLTIDTTHHPPAEEPTPEFWDEWGWLIWVIVAIVIAFLIVFFFAMRWYTKQQRIKGMRRIIKRAADQLIAGNEYTAVIFKSYQKLGVHLRKYGYLRRESETFREFEDAVRSALPVDRVSLDDFLKLLEEARYSSHQIGENQRNNAIRNLRSIERSLDRIIIDEGAALRALERLETEGVKETEIIVSGGGPGARENVPQLLKRAGPQKTKSLPKGGP